VRVTGNPGLNMGGRPTSVRCGQPAAAEGAGIRRRELMGKVIWPEFRWARVTWGTADQGGTDMATAAVGHLDVHRGRRAGG